MIKNRFNKSKGFTLIELLVVIAIIGLLATVVLVTLSSTRVRARDARRKIDIKQLSTAIQLYYEFNNAWPDDATTASGDWNANFKTQLSPFLNSLSKEPLQNNVNRYYGAGRMGSAPDPKCNGQYVIWFYFESLSDPDVGKYTCGFNNYHYFMLLGPW